MSAVNGPATHAIGRAARPDANATVEQKLRGTAQQLQGVFVEQLFKAMRATVPDDGMFSGGQGEEVFRGMMDQHLAELVPSQWHGQHSLGEALYRQLARNVPADPAASAPVAQEKP
jgi:flagellar protein FlgJ